MQIKVKIYIEKGKAFSNRITVFLTPFDIAHIFRIYQ